MKKYKLTYWCRKNGICEYMFDGCKFKSPYDCINGLIDNLSDDYFYDMYYNFIRLEVVPDNFIDLKEYLIL